jgi:hypothetical protein
MSRPVEDLGGRTGFDDPAVPEHDRVDARSWLILAPHGGVERLAGVSSSLRERVSTGGSPSTVRPTSNSSPTPC